MPPRRRSLLPVPIALGLLCAPSLARPEPAGPDTTSDSTRVVRTLEETVVRAERLDELSSESRLRLSRESLRQLPVSSLTQALALQPGVVPDGEVVHVRGARPGELAWELDGISLGEPFRGRAPEIPLVALESVDLLTGGLAPENGGGLAGTLVLRPVAAGPRWNGRALWQTDARTGSHYDRGGAMLSGPLIGGLGLALGGEATLDDGNAPNLRSVQRRDLLGGSWGWRADNRMVAMARLAPVNRPGRFALQGYYSRRVEAPFNPMFSLDGWTTPCADDSCLQGPSYSPTPPTTGYRWSPYDAADHFGINETRRAAVIASAQRVGERDRVRASLGLNAERRITSLDGTLDQSYLVPSHAPVFGLVEDPTSDPFHVYLGDNPYFRHSEARWIEGRLEWKRVRQSGAFTGAGLGATHTRVELREVNAARSPVPYDSVRTYVASAPGAYGWFATRWVAPGMILDAGVRGEWFTPGHDAERMPNGADAKDSWAISPRLGIVYPLSRNDAVHFSYVRITQPPGRDYLYDSRFSRVDPRSPQGNPGLLPATAISYELALRHRSNELWSGRGSLFYRDLFRQVSARSVPGPSFNQSTLRYASDDAGRAIGLELAVTRERAGSSTVTLTYTWMQAEGSESFEDGIPFYPLTLPQPPPISEHPLAWDQRHRLTFTAAWSRRFGDLAWSSVLGSGLPWTPAERREAAADLSMVHSRRLEWATLSDLNARGRFPGSPVTVGLEVRNVFDFRGPRIVSIDGYPNPIINTAYDDYAAFRTETGRGGGAYWNDRDGDGSPGWIPVGDPRLDLAPRRIRLSLEAGW